MLGIEKFKMGQSIEDTKVVVQLRVLWLMAMTLASVMVGVVVVLLVGLFMPNSLIDNNEIFKIIGPAFSMIIGAFVGSFATMMGMKTEPFDPNIKQQQMGTTNYSDFKMPALPAAVELTQEEEDHGPF
jgi:hypothetical protein